MSTAATNARRHFPGDAAYDNRLTTRGEKAIRHLFPIPGGTNLYTDLFNETTNELIEAKGSAARTYIRAGFGQVLDYERFIPHEGMALLVPTQPSPDLIELLRAQSQRHLADQRRLHARQRLTGQQRRRRHSTRPRG